MAYLLDANVFMEAKDRHYGFDFCPAFWRWLEEKNREGLVFSISQVGDELQEGGGELAAWRRARGAGFFLSPDDRVLAAAPRVSMWATMQNYQAAAVSDFLQVADYWLVAFALAHGHVIVTHEIASNSQKKIKIPDVCTALGVQCILPFKLLRSERARFVLGSAAVA